MYQGEGGGRREKARVALAGGAGAGHVGGEVQGMTGLDGTRRGERRDGHTAPVGFRVCYGFGSRSL
jgi:hypothetical protein